MRFQSTHPRGVRPAAAGQPPQRSACFNPRTRVGCDVIFRGHHDGQRGVSIHAPAWGATSSTAQPTFKVQFQSTHPRGVRRCLRRMGRHYRRGFNPRTRVGCDRVMVRNRRRRLPFQSTHPRGVRQGLYVLRIHRGNGFNPRTRVGCDAMDVRTLHPATCFNPRTRVGCDIAHKIRRSSMDCFNPRTRVGCDD